MTALNLLPCSRHSLTLVLVSYCVPFGWFALLTGMFWIGERQLYHALYYATLAAPTLLVLLLQPRWMAQLASSWLVRLFLLFAAYMLMSFCWSGSAHAWLSMAKRPVYIVLVFAAALVLADQRPGQLARATEWAARAASLAAVFSIAYYYYLGNGGRLTGYGALYNALKSTHVFGFFTVYWLCRWYQHPTPMAWTPLAALAPLWLLLLLTGSRTPLLAVAAAVFWLAALQWRRRIWPIIAVGVAAVLIWQFTQPVDSLLGRGLSLRPAIWTAALQQLDGRLLFGLGLNHPQVFAIANVGEVFADTHNISLGVLFEGGLVGLGLWLLIFAYALGYAWRRREQRGVVLASALVVFGVVAGFTEGSGFFSRPSEYWFLLWIPLALLAATQAPTHAA